MFNFVHHVRFLVHDRDAMVEYIQNTFGMKPDRLQVYEQRGMKNAIYKVGPTSFEITEPLDPNSAMGRFLDQQRPGVYHLAWGIDNLQHVAQDLAANGANLRGEGGIARAPTATRPSTSTGRARWAWPSNWPRVNPRCGIGHFDASL